jgi:nucleotide-binding universal stress UspA family protein
MSDQPISLLVCTNGNPTTRPALEYGVWLAGLLHSPVVILGIIESPYEQQAVEKLVDETAKKLAEIGVPYQVQIDRGRGSIVISRYAKAGDYLTVVGPLGRPAWRRIVQGRSFRRLLERVENPILYVPKARIPLKSLLLSMGGLGYAEGVEHLALNLAKAAKARITILHVVEPITLDYPVAREIHDHWQNILDTDTPQGHNLRAALDNLRQAGLEATVKIRHGSIVHEIFEEVDSGDYDLIGLGSPYSVQSLRHLYMPNVTAEVAEAVERPVLTVRAGHDLS